VWVALIGATLPASYHDPLVGEWSDAGPVGRRGTPGIDVVRPPEDINAFSFDPQAVRAAALRPQEVKLELELHRPDALQFAQVADPRPAFRRLAWVIDVPPVRVTIADAAMVEMYPPLPYRAQLDPDDPATVRICDLFPITLRPYPSVAGVAFTAMTCPVPACPACDSGTGAGR